MQEQIAQVKTFLTENVSSELLRNIGISSGILFFVIVAQLIIGEVVAVVDSIPMFNGMMELLGLIVFIKFIRNNLMTAEQRNSLANMVQQTYEGIVK